MVSNIFYFHPYLGKIPILTNIFQRGWNHQPVIFQPSISRCKLAVSFTVRVVGVWTRRTLKENLLRLDIWTTKTNRGMEVFLTWISRVFVGLLDFWPWKKGNPNGFHKALLFPEVGEKVRGPGGVTRLTIAHGFCRWNGYLEFTWNVCDQCWFHHAPWLIAFCQLGGGFGLIFRKDGSVVFWTPWGIVGPWTPFMAVWPLGGAHPPSNMSSGPESWKKVPSSRRFGNMTKCHAFSK